MTHPANIDYQTLKINGVYQQNDAGDLMVRVKLPGGVLSAVQAETLCDLSEHYSNGMLHLTCRGNMELHDLRGACLSSVFRRLQGVGLTTRGACGGAVRGVACAMAATGTSVRVQLLARVLHDHFTGNPHFERLPKKIKLAVQDGYHGAWHLCQDVVMVYLGNEQGRDLCDVWAAGGLGRQPQEGFLLAGRVPFERLIPLIEGVVRVYARQTPAGKRLKHLLADIGEKQFRALLARETAGAPLCPVVSPIDEALGESTAPGARGWIALPVFAGQLPAADLRRVAGIARQQGDGFLAVSRDQNLLVSLGTEVAAEPLRAALREAGGLGDGGPSDGRVCPGTHGCRRGLVPTRDAARRLGEVLAGRSLSWAVCGCPNSCSLPQLADFGVIGVRKAHGDQEARYDLYRRDGEGFGTVTRAGLTLDELLQAVREGI